jgi:hypothetical protein
MLERDGRVVRRDVRDALLVAADVAGHDLVETLFRRDRLFIKKAQHTSFSPGARSSSQRLTAVQ